MTEFPKCKNEFSPDVAHPYHAKKFHGYCFDCANAGVPELVAEIERLRARLLMAAGDDLCRLTQEEIKAMSAGTVKIPPEEIVTLDDGFKYYWPDDSRNGAYSSATLRDIADQLDEMNMDWQKQIDNDL